MGDQPPATAGGTDTVMMRSAGPPRESMNKIIRVSLVAIVISALLSAVSAHRLDGINPPSTHGSVQYDDPYSEFRNARYSNSGLLNERDEIKLGMQLHREVTKKFNLTDVGLTRVDRLGQQCARASLRPNLTYKFHVIQGREINGFSLPGGHVYVTTALVRLANDNELGAVLCHEVGHVVARHSLKTLKKSKEYDDIAKQLGELTGVAGKITQASIGVVFQRKRSPRELTARDFAAPSSHPIGCR